MTARCCRFLRQDVCDNAEKVRSAGRRTVQATTTLIADSSSPVEVARSSLAAFAELRALNLHRIKSRLQTLVAPPQMYRRRPYPDSVLCWSAYQAKSQVAACE